MIWADRERSFAGEVAFIEKGEGPLLVLIHGVGLRAEAWGAQIDTLAIRYRVVAFDLPGHGLSARTKPGPDLAVFTNTIAACIDEPAVIIGHSLGALIALDMASRYPETVKGVAALNAIFDRSGAAKQAVEARARELDGKTPADPTGTLKRWFDDDPGDAQDACRRWLTGVDPLGYQTAYRMFARRDGPDRADLSALKCAALFMTGSREPNSTPKMSRDMAGLARNGRVRIVENAAHMMPMTHPDEVNQALWDLAADAHST